MAKAKEPNTEVMRFMSVRPANKSTVVAPTINTVDYDTIYSGISPAIITVIETANGELLYNTLRNTIIGGGERPQLENDVTVFRGTANTIADRPALFVKFSGFDSVHGWLNANAKSTTVDAAKTAIEGFIGGTINDFLFDAAFEENHLRLWDNLFSQIILPTDKNLRDDISKTLKMFRVLQVIDENEPSTDPLYNFVKWDIMTAVLPKAVFPFAESSAMAPAPMPPSTPPEEPDNTQFFEDIKEIEDAIADLDDVTRQQFDQFRKEQAVQQPPIVPGATSRPPSLRKRSQPEPFELRDEFKNKLKAATLTVFTESGIATDKINALNAKNALKSRMVTMWKRDFKGRRGQHFTLINGAVIGTNLFCLSGVETGVCDYYAGGPLPTRAGKVQSMQVGDLMLVKRYLLKYQPGEVAHIENVLESEYKSRTFEHLKRKEEKNTTENERTTSEERDLQTTDRYSLEQASSEVISQQSSLQAGVSISASYGGMVTLNANANYSNSNSTTSANSSASEFAKEVTSRALKKVTERVRTERVTITIEETKEINKHSFGSEADPIDHNISGVYTWVDKLYLARLMNYGRRLMFEFTIPEPAAFYIYSKVKQEETGDLLKPETLEENEISDFTSITETNYAALAKIYDVADIEPPPIEFKYTSKAYSRDATTNPQDVPLYLPTSSDNDMQVPEGYMAQTARVRIFTSGGWVIAYIADQYVNNFVSWDIVIDDITGTIPVSVLQTKNASYEMTIQIKCRRTPETLEKWQIKTYNSILTAYQKKLSDYENKIAALSFKTKLPGGSNNPLINQQIVREEFKKSVIETLTGQRFEAFMAMQDNRPTQGYPEFDFACAAAEGNYMSFFENAIEWENMTWNYHPYFWGRKPKWVDKMRYLSDQTDPEFTEFLRAGAARVMIPVRPSLSKSMLFYLQSNGEIWSGDDVALTPEYEDLIKDLNGVRIDETTGQEIVEEYPIQVAPPWVIKMPTTLVALPVGMTSDPDDPQPIYNLPDYTDRFPVGELTGVDLNG
jgi:hypothetical protein